MSTLVYLKNFIKDKDIASITPTSIYGVKKVCSKIDFSNCKVIVEYGPATGVFTNYLLDNMSEDARLILIEKNKIFISILKRSIKDPRVDILYESAENVFSIINNLGVKNADYIISGIPFTLIPVDVKSKIVQDTFLSLNEGGKFLAYQTFYQKNNHLKDYLEKYFNTVYDEYELRNIPPMRIYEAIK